MNTHLALVIRRCATTANALKSRVFLWCVPAMRVSDAPAAGRQTSVSILNVSPSRYGKLGNE